MFLSSTIELFSLWRAIDQVSSDPLTGIKLGIETKGRALLSDGRAATENLDTASEHMAGYRKLTSPEEILVDLDKEEFTVGFRWPFCRSGIQEGAHV